MENKETHLPEELIRSLKNVKGFDEKAFIALHESGKQIVSIRLNPAKSYSGSPPSEILRSVPWSSYGFYLDERPSFTLDPAFHAGAYYVQEASSMFLEEVLRQTADLNSSLKVLDLCAAPGGKSTLIQSVISKESLLVSNEVIKTRVNILEENISKWGAINVIVTNNDPRDFQRLENYFDVMVIDAPCSGSGLFRKDPDAIPEWSEQNVELCSQRQQRILADALPALKEGGVLIYATCSYSEKEDEDILDWIVEWGVGSRESVVGSRESGVGSGESGVGSRESGVGTSESGVGSLRIGLHPEWGIVETKSKKYEAYGYRFFPDRVKGEGFFIAAFRKNGSNVSVNEKRVKEKSKPVTGKISAKEIGVLEPYLNNIDELSFIRQNDNIIAMPVFMAEELKSIQQALYIKKAGVMIGSVIRNELIPDHDLAMSTLLSRSVTRIELDQPAAIRYLRKEDIKLEGPLTGWIIVCYRRFPLGWVKVLPNRVNNYYPKSWRILHSSSLNN